MNYKELRKRLPLVRGMETYPPDQQGAGGLPAPNQEPIGIDPVQSQTNYTQVGGLPQPVGIDPVQSQTVTKLAKPGEIAAVPITQPSPPPDPPRDLFSEFGFGTGMGVGGKPVTPGPGAEEVYNAEEVYTGEELYPGQTPATPAPNQEPISIDPIQSQANYTRVGGLPQPVGIDPVQSQTSTTPVPQDTNIPLVAGEGEDTVQKTGDEAFDLFAQYAMQEDPQVEAERRRLERNNLLREEQAKRQAHERAVQAGYRPGTPQYEQMMRAAVTDANNQNIMATNAFHDFARQRRANQQEELMTLYREGTKAEAVAWDHFDTMVKFLPSLKSQEALALVQAGGGNLYDAMRSFYGPDGKLLPQYRDLTNAELTMQGIRQAVEPMKINPDTGVAWVGNEKEEYVEDFYANNIGNILWGEGETTEGRTEAERLEGLVTDAIKDPGTIDSWNSDDWAGVDMTKLRREGIVSDLRPAWEGNERWSESLFAKAKPGDIIQMQDGTIIRFQSHENDSRQASLTGRDVSGSLADIAGLTQTQRRGWIMGEILYSPTGKTVGKYGIIYDSGWVKP